MSRFTPKAVAQAEKDLFNMRIHQSAKKQGIHGNLIQFLEWGMELEDVVEVAGENGVMESYDNMIRLIFPFLKVE
jgi:hypothetical protein